jgi:hypothetical protein
MDFRNRESSEKVCAKKMLTQSSPLYLSIKIALFMYESVLQEDTVNEVRAV